MTGHLNQIDLAELRSRISLIDFASRHVRLHREGRLFKACCPFHREKTPSFTIYAEQQRFHCFGCQAHGDVIEFVKRAEGLTFQEACDRLAAEIGFGAAVETQQERRERAERLRRERTQREARQRAEEAAERDDKIAQVRRRVQRLLPITGTLAERYLIETRGIPRPLEGWPDAVRFDPRAQALVAVATGSDNEPQAAQWIHLTPEATKAPNTADRPTKLSRGPTKGAAVRLPGRSGAPLQVAEGPETGLSVWTASGAETWVALGNVSNLPTPPSNHEIVACLDDDPRHAPAARLTRKAIRHWQRAGATVFVAKPWSVRREDHSDFNDLLHLHGTGAVEERILHALEPAGYQIRRPVPVPIARERLRQRLAVEGDAVLAGEDLTTTTAIAMGAGGGKSEMAMREAVRVMRELRSRGDMRNIAIATPRHDLNDGHAARARALAPDIRFAVYRGADADNPDAPGTKMCRNRDDRRAAELRHIDASKVVCPVCPSREGCGLLAQAAHRADVWFVPHNLLFLPKPRVIGAVAWIIVDENPIAAALLGTGDPNEPDSNDQPSLLTLDTLRRPDTTKDPVDTDRLQTARAQLATALETSPNTQLLRAALIEASLTADTAEQAIGLEYATKIIPDISSDMPLADRMEAVRAADINCDLSRRVALWKEVEALLRGEHEASVRAEVTRVHDLKGSIRAVRLKGRRTVKAGWKVRTTILDATLQPALLREIWPRLKVHDAGALLEAPHRHITQVVDRAFSLSMLDADDPHIQNTNDLRQVKEKRRRQANLRRLHLTIWRNVRMFAPERVLVVAPKRIGAALQALGSFPDNIAWAHHGAVTGRDDWRDVRAVIVAGRSMPPPAAMERQAEALTGRPVTCLPQGQWYPLVDAVRDLVDSTQVAAEAVRHPDPVAEAFRWRSCEGELVQILERARAVNRISDTDRVDMLVLTDVPLPFSIEAMLSAEDVTPRAEDRMLATGGVVLTSSAHGAAAYAGLWRSGTSLRVQRHRERERVHGADWRPLPGLIRVRYRLAVNGSHWSTAYVDPRAVPDVAAWLTDKLGALDTPPIVETTPLQPPIISIFQSTVTQLPTSCWSERQTESWTSSPKMEVKPDG